MKNLKDYLKQPDDYIEPILKRKETKEDLENWESI